MCNICDQLFNQSLVDVIDQNEAAGESASNSIVADATNSAVVDESAPSGSNIFEEVTETAGNFIPGRSYGAGSWGEFNGDGFPDLYVSNHFGTGRNLFLNNGDGTFTDVASQVFLSEELQGDFHGAAWADFDNDGDQDLIQVVGGEGNTTVLGEENLPPRSEPNRLFVNEGGVFRDKAREFGLAYDSAKAQGPIWLDYDNDGWLDLFHGSTQRADGLTPTTVFRQTSTGFEDVGTNVLPTDFQGKTVRFGGLLASFSDSAGLALVFPGNIATILETDTTSFEDVTDSYVNSSRLRGGQDLAIADFNGDLEMDIYLTRGSNDRLLINKDQRLEDSSESSGINNVSNANGSGVVAADFDNDMDVDVYVVRRSDGTTNLPNLLYENQGDGTFTAVDASGGATGATEGNGDNATTADYDLDGFVDLFVTNGSGTTTDGIDQLFRNQGNSNNWLQIDLEGVSSNKDAIGAQVFVTSGGVTQRRDQMGGFHKYSQNHQRLHFGLADNTLVDLIEVRWPSGTVQQLENIAPNQLFTITEEDNSNGGTPPPINGTDGNDSLVGTSDDDIINGLGGVDKIKGLEGDDTIDGGDSRDVLNGGDGNDSLIGGAGNDLISGRYGNDILRGGAGNDILSGNQGNDSLNGGEGGDIFRFRDLPGNISSVDTIEDFETNNDTIQIFRKFAEGLVPGEVIAENQFVLGTAAENSTNRFVYDQSTGDLFLDVDGNGNSEQILIATVSNQAPLNFVDIAIF